MGLLSLRHFKDDAARCFVTKVNDLVHEGGETATPIFTKEKAHLCLKGNLSNWRQQSPVEL